MGAPELTPTRNVDVGGLAVRRALPTCARRTVGAWCFLDHFGPVGHELAGAMQIGPHPHIGLQTVTWLLEGALLHTDSIGSEQPIRPGQLNLMTAGRGIAHAEHADVAASGAHGAELWVALPDGVRDGEPAFEHHAELPTADLGGGVVASVLLGELARTRSPATAHTPIVGAQLTLRAGDATVLPLQREWEHAVVVLDGAVDVDGTTAAPGVLAYVAPRFDELPIRATTDAHVLLLGGEPFGASPLIWWNFVARTRDEIAAAREDWIQDSERFGEVRSDLGRIPAPEVPLGLKPR